MSSQEMLRLILDVFTGADGGVSFVEFKFMLERMEKAKDDGDISAAKILLVVEHFCRLLKASTSIKEDD